MHSPARIPCCQKLRVPWGLPNAKDLFNGDSLPCTPPPTPCYFSSSGKLPTLAHVQTQMHANTHATCTHFSQQHTALKKVRESKFYSDMDGSFQNSALRYSKVGHTDVKTPRREHPLLEHLLPSGMQSLICRNPPARRVGAASIQYWNGGYRAPKAQTQRLPSLLLSLPAPSKA